MIVKGEDRISKQANDNATMLMKCLVRSVLCAKKVVEEHRLTSEAFEWLVGKEGLSLVYSLISVNMLGICSLRSHFNKLITANHIILGYV